ncbi:MAG: CoA activase [Phycisphaerae bacterium]|nr:CoA activase [Phycisphaerae bacterium]
MQEHWREASLPTGQALGLGIDLGSISLDVAVTDEQGNLLAASYDRHQGSPVETTIQVLGELFERIAPSRFGWMVGTGSAGRLVCELLGVPFLNELICQAIAIKRLNPDVRTLIEMGGQDSKILFLPPTDNPAQPIVDFAMNTSCAAGTGSFLDQQASRLGLRIEDEFGDLAMKSETPPRVAGRCSVFAKSDMIHLQQQATPVHDIVAGLCLGLARNLKSNLGRGYEFAKPMAFVGGVAANKGVVRSLETVFDLSSGELLVPDCHACTGAWGAVLAWMREGKPAEVPTAGLKPLHDHLAKDTTLGHRLQPLKLSSEGDPVSRVWSKDEMLRARNGDRLDAYLGIDVGSISTNVVVTDGEREVYAKSYLMTAGRPLEAVRQGLKLVGDEVGEHVRIRGVATTGSGRYLTGDFVGADLVINEITAQATAAALIDAQVDTIFEIGGQDSKYISLDKGVVVDFEMNHACAAGTGSFLEEQAERLDISIKEEFGKRALSSTSPIRLGERCTVFMESDLLSYQQQGAETNDLVSGLSYSIVSNYINRVVAHRKIGERIFFQGGTAFNRGVVAAFQQFTGRPVTVPPHHEVTGAIGAAHLARRHQAEEGNPESNFRGFELADVEYEVRTFECDKCANNCEIKEVILPGRDPLYYGSRCDRYNLKKEKKEVVKLPDLFKERQKLLIKHCHLREEPRAGAKTIGVPLALSNMQLAPFWSTLLGELGLSVVLSPLANKKIIHEGVEAVLSTPCFPVKIAHGHLLNLIEKGVDYIWLPSVVSMPTEPYDTAHRNQLCPYVQTIPYQVEVALEKQLESVKLLRPAIRFQHGRRVLLKCLVPLCREFGVTKGQLKRAVEAAEAAMKGFEQDMIDRGREVLSGLDELKAERNVVIVGRPYNSCDPGACLDIPTKLRKKGVLPIPMEMLDLSEGNITGDRVYHDMYWKYGQKILRSAKVIRNNPRLHAIYISNFSCGPDSFITHFFKRAMSPKPCLLLEIDEHSADAGVITRLEAFLESLKNAKIGRPEGDISLYPEGAHKFTDRKLYVPYMGDGAYVIAAAFKGTGQDTEVMPITDNEALELGRRYTSGKECLPCTMTAGDMVKMCRQPGFDAKKTAFFMPSGSGPCRFGMYNCLHKMILDDIGFGDVPILAPSQDRNFYSELNVFKKDPSRLAWNGIVACDVLQKARLALRPYEKEKGKVDEVYNRSLKQLCELLVKAPSEDAIAQFMQDSAEAFAAVPVDRSELKPRIGIVGEIYVRSHPVSNNQLIEKLEALGAETALASVGEWMYYTNLTRKGSALRSRDYKEWLNNALKDRVQHRIEHRLAAPFVPIVGDVIEPPTKSILECAAPYIDPTFEGEAVMSVGKIIEFCEHGCHGVVNAMPFTCMPSTIVSGVMRKVVRDALGGMPAIGLSYDGQQDPALHTQLEAFVHQARAYQRGRKGKSHQTSGSHA